MTDLSPSAASSHTPLPESSLLMRGANRALPVQARRLRVVISWSEDESGDGADEGVEADVDASALLLSGARRVRSDEDFVFYNQPVSVDGSVTHTGRARLETGMEERLAIDLDEVGEDVEVIAFAASRGEGTFGQLSALRLAVWDETNTVLVTCVVDDASTETAMVLAEVYRRAGVWKVRSVGQGWDSGLAGLAQDFGVSVEDESVDEELEDEPNHEELEDEPDDEELEDEPDDEELEDEPDDVAAGSESLKATTAGTSPESGFGEPSAVGLEGDASDLDPDVDAAVGEVAGEVAGDAALADASGEDLVEVVDPDEAALAADAGAEEIAVEVPAATVTITISTGADPTSPRTAVSEVPVVTVTQATTTAPVADLPSSAPTSPPAAAGAAQVAGGVGGGGVQLGRKGVRTRKTTPTPVRPPALRLAGDPGWQAARLFSIYGVGSAGEQEKRATSALLATVMGVRAFARGIVSHFGAPGGAVEAYLEVPFDLGETRVYPDGVLRVARAGKEWTGLVEVKTGDGQLRREQVENYLDVARAQGFDAVITISNDIPPAAGEHPVEVDKRKLRKVALHHLSWAEVLHEAQMTLTHRGVADPVQAWVLHELIRYLQHPRSGASGFEDMGSAWVGVREAVSAGTLRAGDRKVPAVAEAWIRLVRQLRLRLTAELGVQVTHVLARKVATDPMARVAATTARLVGSGELEATVRVPGAAGPLTVVADLRTSQVRTSVRVAAPQEGGAQRRVSWLLRQLKDAPDDVLVDVTFTGRSGSTCERLGDVREKPAALLPERDVEVAAFTLSRSTVMGTKRSGVKNAFIPSVTDALEGFYTSVVQPLRAWVPPAPKLPDDIGNDTSGGASGISTEDTTDGAAGGEIGVEGESQDS